VSLAVRALDTLACAIPPRALLGLADAAGDLWWWASPGRRRIAHENLRIAFGARLDDRARARLGRTSCRALVRVFAELALARRLLGSPRTRARRLAFHGDWDLLAADARRGGGLIVTAHLGNWEVGALGVRHRGVRLRAMARSVEHPVAEGWLERCRGGPRHVIPKRGGLAAVLRTLRQGEWVALLIDQNAGRHGMFLPFFGLEASTFPTPAALAARTGAPLYLGVCLRRPGTACFDVHLERLPDPGPQDVRALTLALNRRLEAWIARRPEQYNWVHRRWKTRPPGRDGSETGQPFYARLWPAGHPRTGLR
jgi:KDO2-lipid IV(A) lauroyltransferase